MAATIPTSGRPPGVSEVFRPPTTASYAFFSLLPCGGGSQCQAQRESAQARSVVSAAPCLRLQLIDALGGIGLAQRPIERHTGLIAQRLEIGGLRPGHCLAAGGPAVRILFGVRREAAWVGFAGFRCRAHTGVTRQVRRRFFPIADKAAAEATAPARAAMRRHPPAR